MRAIIWLQILKVIIFVIWRCIVEYRVRDMKSEPYVSQSLMYEADEETGKLFQVKESRYSSVERGRETMDKLDMLKHHLRITQLQTDLS